MVPKTLAAHGVGGCGTPWSYFMVVGIMAEYGGITLRLRHGTSVHSNE